MFYWYITTYNLLLELRKQTFLDNLTLLTIKLFPRIFVAFCGICGISLREGVVYTTYKLHKGLSMSF